MERVMPFAPGIPCSTYRLQFNPKFRFTDGTRIIPYLHSLGITDIYGSPCFMARSGSPHGYDIVDHNRLNPEIGTEGELEDLSAALTRHGMGYILDIVPNHMCITSNENVWWMDVLENGPSSVYAKFFDINWEPVKEQLRQKVLLPILGRQYGEVLEDGELTLSFEKGSFFVLYYDHKLPLRPRSWVMILEFRLESLAEVLSGERTDDLAEYLSIVSSLKHLPPYTDSRGIGAEERRRESGVAKRRLWELCQKAPVIMGFVHANIDIFNGIKGREKSFGLLDRLLNDQAYRLSHWAVATEEINYRRFFDINSLAAIRMERPEVFEKTHGLLLRLIREGKITGIRVDHPDGLRDPLGYFERLQRACFRAAMLRHLDTLGSDTALPGDTAGLEKKVEERYNEALAEDPGFKPFYIVAEKILVKSEKMPGEWPVFSTTGYVFLNSLNGIFVATENLAAMDRVHSWFTGMDNDYSGRAYSTRKLIMEVAMAGEINALGHRLNRISEQNRRTRDFTLNSLTRAIIEVISCFPVYRTYINDRHGVTDRDRRHIELAVARAKRKNPSVSESVFNFLKDVLLLRYPDNTSDWTKQEWLDFVMQFQQVTGPVMAKGLEDTASYIFTRLISLNEVGGNPDKFGTTLDTFHGQNMERTKFWPHALIATSTHDSKRSEDVRARINVLSEMPHVWKERLGAWRRLNRDKKTIVDSRPVPDRNEEYYLYQVMIGAWPPEMAGEEEYEGHVQRIKDHFLKALREAKINSSWINPDILYEEGAKAFIDAITARSPHNRFLQDFLVFQEIVSHYGMYNSLSQTLLKITSPGVPDFYQGTELWNFSLVDPDNRRPVDYGARAEMLDEIRKRMDREPLSDIARDLTLARADGRIKLFLTYMALNFRRTNRQLFEKGGYRLLPVTGQMENNLCAFERRFEKSTVIVAAPRFFTRLMEKHDDMPVGERVWGSSMITVPGEGVGVSYRDVFTGRIVKIAGAGGTTGIFCSHVFDSFPVGLLARVEADG